MTLETVNNHWNAWSCFSHILNVFVFHNGKPKNHAIIAENRLRNGWSNSSNNLSNKHIRTHGRAHFSVKNTLIRQQEQGSNSIVWTQAIPSIVNWPKNMKKKQQKQIHHTNMFVVPQINKRWCEFLWGEKHRKNCLFKHMWTAHTHRTVCS